MATAVMPEDREIQETTRVQPAAAAAVAAAAAELHTLQRYVIPISTLIMQTLRVHRDTVDLQVGEIEHTTLQTGGTQALMVHRTKDPEHTIMVLMDQPAVAVAEEHQETSTTTTVDLVVHQAVVETVAHLDLQEPLAIRED